MVKGKQAKIMLAAAIGITAPYQIQDIPTQIPKGKGQEWRGSGKRKKRMVK